MGCTPPRKRGRNEKYDNYLRDFIKVIENYHRVGNDKRWISVGCT